MTDVGAARSDGAEEPNSSRDGHDNHHDGDGDGDDSYINDNTGHGVREGDEEDHDEQEQEEEDQDGGSHGGATATPSTKASATVKDKYCQYCHQKFTSSSLGRHLDQYLFKKKPDGIHDVDEIRRLRSTITRRTARGSGQQQGNKRESPSDDAAAAASSATVAAKTTTTASPDQRTAPPLYLNSGASKGGYRVVLNQPSWHATGVINDIPNSSQVSQLRLPPSTREEPPRRVWSFSNSSNGNNSGAASNPETARALELALQEVLDSVRAATTRIEPQQTPFDFDVQSQTFPSLCLHALPPPPSLFSTHPFPSPGSFPLNPPTADQHETVRHALRSKIQQWKAEQLGAAEAAEKQHTAGSGSYSSSSTAPPHSHPTTIDPVYVERTALQQEDMVLRHLDSSLNYWLSLPSETRRDTWHLEITRAFARESEKRKKVEEQLHRTQQEANYLRTQVDRLASCQWPREFAIFPPDMLPLSPAVARDLDNNKESNLNNAESPRWDYDNLVAKWKRVVMHDKSMGRVGVGINSSDPSPDAGRGGAQTGGQSRSQFTGKTAPQPSLPGLRGQSPPHAHAPPPRRMNQVSPDSPSSNPRQLPASTSILGPYATRETGDAGDPSRPSKRQRTTLDDRPRSSGRGADLTTEHGQQTQRLPSLSAASTPLSASSPYQASPYSAGVHHPYQQSSSSAASAGVAGGDTSSHNPYPLSSAPDRRMEQAHSGGGGGGGSEPGGLRSYASIASDSGPHRETNAHHPVAGGGGVATDTAKLPSLHSISTRSDEQSPGAITNHTTDIHRRNGPGSLLTMYPQSHGP